MTWTILFWLVGIWRGRPNRMCLGLIRRSVWMILDTAVTRCWFVSIGHRWPAGWAFYQLAMLPRVHIMPPKLTANIELLYSFYQWYYRGTLVGHWWAWCYLRWNRRDLIDANQPHWYHWVETHLSTDICMKKVRWILSRIHQSNSTAFYFDTTL